MYKLRFQKMPVKLYSVYKFLPSPAIFMIPFKLKYVKAASVNKNPKNVEAIKMKQT